jgi:uncharacterized membrane protein YeaQ/YmgE (transglycosylase-associated protein family)
MGKVDRVSGSPQEHALMNTSGLFTTRFVHVLAVVALLLGFAWPGTTLQAAEKSITDGVEQAAKDAQKSVEEAGKTAADKIEQLWHSIEGQRIKNRTRDEIVAWVIMGILVGGLAGTFSAYGTSGMGRFINLVFGLIGAFIGGVLAAMTQLDFGWGPVLIRYEELLLSFVGAAMIVLLARWMRNRSGKKTAEKK